MNLCLTGQMEFERSLHTFWHVVSKMEFMYKSVDLWTFVCSMNHREQAHREIWLPHMLVMTTMTRAAWAISWPSLAQLTVIRWACRCYQALMEKRIFGWVSSCFFISSHIAISYYPNIVQATITKVSMQNIKQPKFNPN